MTLRRRLTIALALAVGVSAAALAVGSYFVVRHNLLADSVNSSAQQARRNLRIAPLYLKKGPGKLLEAYGRAGGFDTVGVQRGLQFSSRFFLGLEQVPPELRRLVRGGQLGYQRRSVAGQHYLIVGGPVGKQTELYYFFSEQSLRHELAVLRNILLIGGGILVLLAAFAGAVLARRTLRPVARASEAALSAAQARERRFTADVAHELRTPLAALVGEASLLAEHLDRMPPESRRPAELLISDVGRLRALVEDLMEISRLDAGAEAVHEEPVDLATLTKAIVRARGWDGQVRLDADETAIETDPRRVERILSNLIGNALEHGGDRAEVRVGRENGRAFVEVADRGPGISPEHLPHLFERFYKADPSRSGRGSGLGLAIAQENARLLGGAIEVWSEPGAGSRFTLRL
jgi:signal transduction histidine kinase